MTTITVSKPSTGWNITLWILQVVLAGMFGMAGFLKTLTPISDLAAQMVWPGDIPSAMVRFIGFSELAGAIGLLLPSILRFRPSLTIWAALGLGTVMVLAIVFHITRGEWSPLPMNLVFAVTAGVIAWGRSRKAPIKARG